MYVIGPKIYQNCANGLISVRTGIMRYAYKWPPVTLHPCKQFSSKGYLGPYWLSKCVHNYPKCGFIILYIKNTVLAPTAMHSGGLKWMITQVQWIFIIINFCFALILIFWKSVSWMRWHIDIRFTFVNIFQFVVDIKSDHSLCVRWTCL